MSVMMLTADRSCHTLPMSEAPYPPHNNQPIIIADAEEEHACHVERQLQRAGVKNPVITFQNGDDLHAYLADAAQKDLPAPCVLFLDPRMPGANGYDPIRWLRREKGGSEIFVAIISSADEPDEVESANELGVQVFLKKHADLGSLSAVIDYLSGNQPLDPAAPRIPVVPAK